jgi:hypothetical protein
MASYSEALGGSVRAPQRADEEGFIDGSSPDGLTWTLRVIQRVEQDSDTAEQHHILWNTDAVRLDDVVLVIGSSASDADLWLGMDGIDVRGDKSVADADAAIDELERLVQGAQSGALSGQEFMEKLGRSGGDNPMLRFMNRAKPFTLPHPLAAPWHAFTTDAVAAARLLTPVVMTRLEGLRDRLYGADRWIRVWVGAPNVRIQAYLADPESRDYQNTVALGLELARAARAIGNRAAVRGH